MKILVTRQNEDGTYDACGMNNRFIVSGYKTIYTAIRYRLQPYCKPGIYRIEMFNGIFDSPVMTIYWTKEW